jgi:membrane protein implicated in regulation of membrane protease activity
MIELIVAHPHAFWLSLGGLLLAAEMLGGNGYLLWSGVPAVITGLLVWILPLDWAWQGALFAVLTLVAAWLWWRWLNRRVNEQKPLTRTSTSADSRLSAAFYARHRAGKRARHARGRQLVAGGG